MAAAPGTKFPKDGLVIISMMKDLGITNYEPRVVNQLMEFAARYVSSILEDARTFANHAKKKSIDNEDVKLAVMMQLDKIFTTPPPRDLLLEVARTKNSTPLPLVKPHCGLRLPPDRYCFSACNYRLKNIKKVDNKQKFSLGGALGGIKIAKPSSTAVKRPINVPRTPNAPNNAKSVKLGSMLMNQQKTKIQIGGQTAVEVKMEQDSTLSSAKRKREEDE